MKYFFSLTLVACLLCACDDQRVYEQNTDFENGYWIVTELPSFEFEVADTTLAYNLFCNIRNSSTYPYSRIFIGSTLTDSTGTELKKELLSADLFDRKTGEPLGSSALGDIFDHRITIAENVRFKNTGNYKIEFEQFMRRDTLDGVLSIGARVEKALKK